MIEGVPSERIGRLDLGADEKPSHPCTKSTWCKLELGHAGDCEEVPRKPMPPSDYGPKRKWGWGP